jgi:hypothetical protein
LKAAVKNWRQSFGKLGSRSKNVGGDGSGPDWEIKMAGELTPSVRLRMVARFLMRCLLHYQESHPRVNFYLHDVFNHGFTRMDTDKTLILTKRGEGGEF